MTQYARPSSDISNSTWTKSTGTVLWDLLNEDSYSDTDYMRATGATNQTCEVKLSSLSDPTSSANHIVRFRAKATGSSGGEKMTVTLYQGATLIATIVSAQTITRSTFNEYNYTLTAAQADAITDYTDLRIRFATTSIGAGETIDVSWVVMEIPSVLFNTKSNTPSYAIGNDNGKSNFPAYVIGSEGAKSSTPSYGLGSGIGLSSIPVYVSPIDTTQNNVLSFATGSLDTSSSIPVYLIGSDILLDSTSGFALGNDSLSGSTPSYVQGFTSAVAQPAVVSLRFIVPNSVGTNTRASTTSFLCGSAQASEIVSAYLEGTSGNAIGALFGFLAGIDSGGAQIQAFGIGSANTNGNVTSFIGGQDTAKDNRQSYTLGSTNVNSGLGIYMSGSSLSSSNTQVFVSGSETTKTALPSYISGKNTSLALSSAFVAGGENPSSSLAAFISVIAEIKVSTPAFIDSFSPGVSCIIAFLIGKDSTFDQKSAYSIGGITSSTSAYLSGGIVATSYASGYAIGQDTGVASVAAFLSGISEHLHSSISSFTLGAINIPASQNSYVLGASQPQSSAPAFVLGSIDAKDSVNSYVPSIAIANSSKPAYICGYSANISEIFSYTAGKSTLIANLPAYIVGSIRSNVSVYVGSAVVSSGSAHGYLNGFDTLLGNTSAFLRGSVNTQNNTSAITVGYSSAKLSVDGFVSGKLSLLGIVQSFILGSLGNSSRAPAYLSGAAIISDTHAFLVGSMESSSSTGGETYGSEIIVIIVHSYTSGIGTIRATQNTYIDGVFGDQAWSNTAAYISAIAVDYELEGVFDSNASLNGVFTKILSIDGIFDLQKELNGVFTKAISIEGTAKVLYNLLGRTKSP